MRTRKSHQNPKILMPVISLCVCSAGAGSNDQTKGPLSSWLGVAVNTPENRHSSPTMSQ